MSVATITILGSLAVSHATQLSQNFSSKRNLSNLGIALQKGELAPASTILAAFFKANPQYTSTSADDSQSQDPLGQDLEALATAISSNQVGAAQTAWAQVQNDLTNDVVAHVKDGTTSTPGVLAESKASKNEPIVTDTVAMNPGGDVSIAALVGGSDSSCSPAGLSSALSGNQPTYQQSGNLAIAPTISSTGNLLNTAV